MTPLSVLHTEASRGWGGQEVRIVTEAGWLRDRGARVVLAAQPGSRILEEARRAGLETVGVSMRAAWDVPAVLRLTRLVRRRRVGVVHTHSSIDAWIGGLAARLTGVPVARSRHVSIPIRPALNLVYTRLADRIITSGEAIRGMVLAIGVNPGAVVAIPAGIDLDAFAPGPVSPTLRKELGLGGAPVIGSVAMFRGSKGHAHLLDAFALVRGDRPGAQLVLVGDGIRRASVETLAAQRGLGDAVRFTGFRRDVADLLRLMDCFVLASTRTEGVPQSLLQALAVGTPVVGSSVGGIPEVIEHGVTGLLVPPEDPRALAHAISAVVASPDAARRRALAGRELVRRRFSRERAIDQLLALYAELVR